MKVKILFISLLMILLIIPISFAGIKWVRESAYEEEGSSFCIEYGLYNPQDKDVNVELGVSDELQNLDVDKPETLVVRANTPTSDAVPVSLCFKTPKVYEEDCLISSMLCAQTCDTQEISYKGNVIVTSVASGITGSGSGVSIAEAVPLEVRIKCTEHDRDYMPVYVAILIIVLIIIAIIYYKRRSSESQVIS